MLAFIVFYNKKSCSGVLSFATVVHKFGISIDTDLDPALNLHLKNDTIIIFKQCSRGISYFDTTNMKHTIIIAKVTYNNFLNII